MTESEFQNFLKGLHIIDRKIVDIAYLSTPDEEERQKRFASLLKKAEQLQAHTEEIERLWNEAAAKVEEGRKEWLKGTFTPFTPFTPPDESKKSLFPVNRLPDGIKEMVTAIAESLQVPPDMPATAALGVVSACIQGKFAVQVKPDWKEQANLYILVIARPSERKSPVLQILTAPLYAYSKEQNFLRGPAIQEYQTKRKIIEGAIESLTARASKKGDVGYFEISEKQRELENLKPVHPVRLIADDVTPEKLVSLMAANDGKMAVISAEGGLFDILAGLYSLNVNIDPFLKAYTGDSIQIDRQGRPSETIDNPALTMLLMIQPSVLEKIIENGKFNGRGLTARFLYSYPMSMIGKGRKFETDPIGEDNKEVYESLLYSLLKIPLGAQPRILTLSKEAYILFSDWFYWIEDRFNNEFYKVESWAGKLAGNTARIAGVLHCCQHQERGADYPISGKAMQDAIEIAKYFVDHALFIFEKAGETDTQAEKDAKYILERLQSTGETEISISSALDLCKKFGRRAEMQPGLDVLTERGYVVIDKRGTKGRPTEKICFNPEMQKRNSLKR
ncbi:YfjI family protein [Hydrogeniiclostridium mannosilyticum]|uniref:YfjI family protein n=1 Tax=Hydrogeniiclostridium mannosilyticum TaxID=2764322 RepID=UPI00399B9915